MDLSAAVKIASSGMKAQGTRLRVISENLANADSTAQTPGGEPYRRKLITFRNMLDKEVNAKLVQVDKITPDPGDFELKYDPHHPAANSEGYVLTPNVNPLIEIGDMREAQRSYEANLDVISVAKSMLQKSIDILKS
jgi:flagellar basal-body rod protein FlgC